MRKLLFLFLALPFWAAAQNNVIPADWKKLETPEYSLQYPPGWEQKDGSAQGAQFMLFAPQENPADVFKENINLLIQNLKGMDMDLNAFVNVSETQIKTYFTDAKIERSVRLKKGEQEYHEIDYSGVYNSLSLHWVQRYWVVGERAFVLTFTSQPEAFQQYLPTTNLVFSSFDLRVK